jgi:phage terminase large subunit-like protein
MASRKVRLINQLTHTKGPFAGRSFQLRHWQEHGIVRPLFATGADGRRIVRTCLLMLPRKNGKSELAAALAIDGLLFDNERGAEVISAAADKGQAALVFDVAAAMIRADPELIAVCDILDYQKRIVHRKSGSVYRAISAEAYSKHGFNCSRLIYDEIHAVGADRELWDVLTTSTGGRDQPLTIAISTAGYDRHSLLWELYTYAKKCLADPTIDPSFLPIIYEAAPDADWTDPGVWRGCNPALGDFRSLEEMTTACARAQEIPAQENNFRRLYLNQWTEQSSRWLTLASWDACRGTVSPAALKRRPCYIGLDLSMTRDLTAVVAVFPFDDGTFQVIAHFFIPAATAAHRGRSDRVRVDEWTRGGWLTATPGEVVNYEAVRAYINELGAAYDVREIAFDPWNSTDLITRLADIDGFKCFPMRQGYGTLSAPSKQLETAILNRSLVHDGNPLLRLNVASVALETDGAGNIKPDKDKSTDQIDGVVALIMALDRLTRNAAAPPKYQLLILGRDSTRLAAERMP